MTAPLDRLEAGVALADSQLADDVRALIAVARALEEEVRAYRERQRSGWEWTRIAALERLAEALAALEGGAA